MQTAKSNFSFNRKLTVLLLLFLVMDLAISFNQYYNTPIDGDITSIVLPTEKYKGVLSDPAGMDLLTKDAVHTQTNRFTSIAIVNGYFRAIPFLSQTIFAPITSIYFSAALLKILTHILLLFIAGSFMAGRFNLKDNSFLFSLLLATVFFQVGGYSFTMGIIDTAVSYTVYYTLSVAFLLILLFPLFQKVRNQNVQNISLFRSVCFMLLAIMIPFFGNQIPVLVFAMIITLLVMKFILKNDVLVYKNFYSDKKYFYSILLLILFCCYSYIISLYDPERNLTGMSLAGRYAKLPIGLLNILSGKPGLWILSLLIIINSLLLWKMKKATDNLRLIRWFAVFSLVYILLLPIDGYYDYRPNIIRRDNFLPVTLLMIFIFIRSSWELINAYRPDSKEKRSAIIYVSAIILFFTISDRVSLRLDNCERASLEMLSISEKDTVVLSDRCRIASWYVIADKKDSEVNARVFNYWNITKKPRYYFQN